MLTNDLFNRIDDHLPPTDLPARTGEVVRKQGCGSAADHTLRFHGGPFEPWGWGEVPPGRRYGET